MKKSLVYYLAIVIVCFIASCDFIKKQKKIKGTDSKENLCFSKLAIGSERHTFIYDSIDGSNKKIRLDSFIGSTLGFKDLNGCILVHQSGVDVYQKCAGATCLSCDNPKELTTNSVFQLASLSKTFTAVAILKLVENKKIHLEDSVQKFYPNFPYKNITIRLLLSHRSGLPNYLYAFEDSSRTCPKPDNQTLMQWFENDKPPIYYYANRGFSYNNTNYAVLAAIIEKVSGQRYKDYLIKELFIPLKMKSTFVGTHLPNNENITKGHEGTQTIGKDYFDSVVGDKGIYSTMNDLFTWYTSLHALCLLKNESLQLAFTPQSFENEGVRNYGLGFRLKLDPKTKNVKYIYHNGWWKGYNALFWFSPTSKSFVLILTNVKNKSIFRINPIIEILEGVNPEEPSAEVLED